MGNLLGCLWRGWIILRTLRAVDILLGLLMGGGLGAWALSVSVWDWLWKQEPAVIGGILFGLIVAVLVLILFVLGAFVQDRGITYIKFNEAMEHICFKSFKGVWRLRRYKTPATRTLPALKFSFNELKDFGVRGLIHMRGYKRSIATPQPIHKDDWAARGLGFDVDRDGRPAKIKALGHGMLWENPEIPESELYRYWPPVPFINSYRRLRAWLAANT